MIRSLLTDSQSYFQSYKNYFVAIYLSFLAFPAGDLTLIAAPQPIWMRLALQSILTSGASIAAIWGYVATKLYLYPEPLSLRRILSGPFRPIFLLYAIYLVPIVLGIVVAWTDPAAISTDNIQVTFVVEGIRVPSATFGQLALAIGASLVSGLMSE